MENPDFICMYNCFFFICIGEFKNEFNTLFEPEKVCVKSYAVAEYKTFSWFYTPHGVIMLYEF